MFEKATGARTAALLANVSGTPLCMVEVGGSFGRELAAKGEPRWSAFALDWLADLYGADVKKAVKRTHATRWNAGAVGARRASRPRRPAARRRAGC